MCGICGIAGDDWGDERELARIVGAMNESLIHRGPDDAGVWTSKQMAIAVRRLSIIDLPGGHQPIENETGELRIVLNGEIYNYRELREGLIAKGHRFRTKSDTEVVLHLFEEYGLETAGLLKGMFALCIVNDRDKSLYIARDRFGEKPLYLWNSDSQLAFSSELASLLKCSAVPRRINLPALKYYLRYRFIASPWTMFRDIVQLPAGHWMLWRNGKLNINRYFDYQAHPDHSLDTETAKGLVQQALLDAVDRQRISDVPVGAFLSGGIDSSTVVAALQRQSSKPVPTFTARFENAQYDESPIARTVAKHLGTDHHEFVIRNNGFDEEDLWRIIKHAGQPFADSSAIPTFYICRQIRGSVTVCLSGDGGDEMFGGYDFFLECQKVDRIASLAPRFAFRTLNRIARGLSQVSGFRNSSRLRQAIQVSDSASRPRPSRFFYRAPLFDEQELHRLVSPAIHDQLGSMNLPELDSFAHSEAYPTRLRQLMAYRIGFQLPEDMLLKVDRMSMASSLEVRAPMLDVAVSEVAARMPDHLLINSGVTKYILREAAREWLPEAVFNHPKWGFAIPLHDYQNARYEELCRALIFCPGGLVSQLFNRNYVEQIVNRGLTRKRDAADVSVFRATHQVWALLQLAAWADYYQVSW